MLWNTNRLKQKGVIPLFEILLSRVFPLHSIPPRRSFFCLASGSVLLGEVHCFVSHCHSTELHVVTKKTNVIHFFRSCLLHGILVGIPVSHLSVCFTIATVLVKFLLICVFSASSIQGAAVKRVVNVARCHCVQPAMKQLQPQCLFTAFNINAEASSSLDVCAPLFLPVVQKVAPLLLQKCAVKRMKNSFWRPPNEWKEQMLRRGQKCLNVC